MVHLLPWRCMWLGALLLLVVLPCCLLVTGQTLFQQQSSNVPVRARATYVTMNNRLWALFGGNPCGVGNSPSVSWSADQGMTWSPPTKASGLGVDYLTGHVAIAWYGQLIMLGGTQCNVGIFSYVWSSEDGVTWSRRTANWAGRVNPLLAVVRDRLYMIGGSAYQLSNNEVWWNRNPLGNPTWTLEPTRAPWESSRDWDSIDTAPGSVVTSSNRILVAYRGLWISNVDVSAWSELTSSTAGFGIRASVSLVNLNGILYSVAGVSGGSMQTDVWTSLDEGKSWMLVAPKGGFTERRAQSVVVNGRAMILIAGDRNGAQFPLAEAWIAYV